LAWYTRLKNALPQLTKSARIAKKPGDAYMLAPDAACVQSNAWPYHTTEDTASYSGVKFWLMFNWAERWRKDFADSDAENPFESYLDGYFNSFDFYPVCTRKLHEKNDAYSLWVDFLKVAQDVGLANEGLKATPERFLAIGALTKDEIETRKKAIAEEIIRQIGNRNDRSKTPRGDNTA
jgi:hypothetical protein